MSSKLSLSNIERVLAMCKERSNLSRPLRFLGRDALLSAQQCRFASVEGHFIIQSVSNPQFLFDPGLMSIMRNFINRMMDDLSSPELDPSFGLGLPVRLMRQKSKQNRAMANIVNDKDALKINLDVRHFSPDELRVKVVDDYVVVEGKHEEKDDEHGAVSRQFVRRYRIPTMVDKASIISSLSSDGILQIHAPKVPPSEEDEREVPITVTNLPALEPEGDNDEVAEEKEEDE